MDKLKKQRSLENKYGNKTSLWIRQTTNWRDCTRDDLNMAQQRTERERGGGGETESLLIVTQYAIITNHIKAKVQNTQHNNNGRLCSNS